MQRIFQLGHSLDISEYPMNYRLIVPKLGLGIAGTTEIPILFTFENGFKDQLPIVREGFNRSEIKINLTLAGIKEYLLSKMQVDPKAIPSLEEIEKGEVIIDQMDKNNLENLSLIPLTNENVSSRLIRLMTDQATTAEIKQYVNEAAKWIPSQISLGNTRVRFRNLKFLYNQVTDGNYVYSYDNTQGNMDIFGLQDYLRSSQKPSYQQLEIYKKFDGSIKKLTENNLTFSSK